jgi:hypothetical protein
MIHVTAIITPCVPPKVVGQVTSLIMVTALPEVYGLPKGGPERREVPAPELPAITRTGLKATVTEVVVSS